MKVESELCPKIRKRLYQEKLACSNQLACQASHTKFEVKNGLESFIVDLEEKKCSYRKWDIIGIPCCHAISCIFSIKKMLKSMSMLATKGLPTLIAINPLQSPSMARICGDLVNCHLCNPLSRGDLLVSLRRRGHQSLMNLEVTDKIEVQASQNNASYVGNQDTREGATREKQEGTPPCLGVHPKPVGPLGGKIYYFDLDIPIVLSFSWQTINCYCACACRQSRMVMQTAQLQAVPNQAPILIQRYIGHNHALMMM